MSIAGAGRGVLSVVLLVLGTARCGTAPSDSRAADDGRSEPERGSSSGGVNRPEIMGRPYVILVSFDGFRYDFPEIHSAPALDRLASAGIRARALRPVFPTKTFPNHYSLATGMYPGNHGLVANSFMDPRTGGWYSISDREAVEDGAWYGGEPIWVTAERQGMVTAAFFFVGTEADVKGVRPTHWRVFDEKIPGEQRVDQVLAWLGEPPETRPHLITLYFEDVDTRSHGFGPESAETGKAVAQVDGYLNRLLNGVDDLEFGDSVFVVVVSDHGQLGYAHEDTRFSVDRVLDLEGVQRVGGGPVMYLHVSTQSSLSPEEIRDRVNEVWNHGVAYLTEEAPRNWELNGNPRFGQVVLVADPGYLVGLEEWESRPLRLKGDHGWAPETPEMEGIFMASGPGLPAGMMVEPVSAVDIYPFLAAILKLEPAGGVDGDPSRLVPLLQPNP